MAEILRKLAANTHRQFFFVVTPIASTRGLVENFQLICFWQRANTYREGRLGGVVPLFPSGFPSVSLFP